MEKLDFRPAKSKSDFRRNYKLHDKAEESGKNLLTQWGIKFSDFGEDKRFERVWEKGADKPDLILELRGNKAFLDWKGKSKSGWLVNERAYQSYMNWSKKHNMPMFIAFFVFDSGQKLTERRFAEINQHTFSASAGKQWDKNKTVEVTGEPPIFNRENLVTVWRSFLEQRREIKN